MPSLLVPALQKQIASRKLGPVYLFVGEDVHRIEQLVDEIEATVDPADRPFAVERVYAAEAGGAPVDIAASARVFPMLGDRRIVIVLRAERLLKPKRAAKAAETDEAAGDGGDDETPTDLTPLEDYLGNPPETTSLVFVATEMDRTRRFTKKLIEKAQVVEFGGLLGEGRGGPSGGRIAPPAWVNEAVAGAGRTIDPAALQLLVNFAGGDISKLRGDLERLLLYTEGQPRISADDVREVVSPDALVDDWGITNALSDGDPARALREIGARLDRGDSPHAIVGQLRWWVSARLAEAQPERARPAMESLLRTDLALKSSGGDQRVLVERLVVDLAGPPLPRRGGWR